MKGYLLIIDNAFEDTSLIDRLYHLVNGLDQEVETTYPLTAAFDLEEKDCYPEIENIKRSLTKKLWFDVLGDLTAGREQIFKSFEIWTHCMADAESVFLDNSKYGSLSYHVDHDEGFYKRTKNFSLPMYGSLTYIGPKEGINGGELYINTEGLSHVTKYIDKNGEPVDKLFDFESGNWEKINFKYNRVIVFDPTFPHLVAPVLRHPHNRRRVSLAINAWDSTELDKA